MKLVLKNSEAQLNKRLSIALDKVPCLETAWHYHSQYELIYIRRSSGIRFVGDSVANFKEGELVLVGPNLPHLWRHRHIGEKVDILVIKFERDFIGEGTFDRPEFTHINQLLEMARFGLQFCEERSDYYKADLDDLLNCSYAEQSIKLLKILNGLASSGETKVLSTSDMRQEVDDSSERIEKVLKYIANNYDRDLDLQEIADIACMTTNSFCRFFKKTTNKSFKKYLNEVRIKNASRLLIQEDFPIADICYEVGFNSVTNFNKHFKQIVGKTPKEYRLAI
ncbi:AraC family transcriptional regulator [Sediminitomix flava]|uniref:AraC family transcriptional regulator n=1 Tax=Sediminitomix flava TaxID=379075 RepID=A0A315Z890_SEDFL|nr:AraC family transcriptional regulator [Sediminitomix flava]PWJ41796.1 AraC family transcriptional regulator [Sediminitomix flava]